MPSEFSSNIRQVARELKTIDRATATLVRKAIRVAVADAAQSTTDAIRAEAGRQGLHRAAAATTVKVSFSVRGGGATIATNRRKAPMARPLERGSQGSGGAYNRHPVFGRKVYVNQPTRPYFFGSAKAQEPISERKLIEAVDEACRLAGWHGF